MSVDGVGFWIYLASLAIIGVLLGFVNMLSSFTWYVGVAVGGFLLVFAVDRKEKQYGN